MYTELQESFSQMLALERLVLVLTPMTQLKKISSAISMLFRLKELVLGQEEIRFGEEGFLELAEGPVTESLKDMTLCAIIDLEFVRSVIVKCKKLRKFKSPVEDVAVLQNARPDVQFIHVSDSVYNKR